jgi:Predicted ornithine cyclodeaminase, mu-crystallin homolog
MPTVLSEADVRSVLELAELLPVVRAALVKQTSGAVERPARPHFSVGVGLDNDGDDDADGDSDAQTGTAITMPAYVHGSPYFATKLVSLNEGNTERGLPTLHAQLVLTDAEDGTTGSVSRCDNDHKRPDRLYRRARSRRVRAQRTVSWRVGGRRPGQVADTGDRRHQHARDGPDLLAE